MKNEKLTWVLFAIALVTVVWAASASAVDPVTSAPYVLQQQSAPAVAAPVKIDYPTPLRDLLFGKWLMPTPKPQAYPSVPGTIYVPQQGRWQFVPNGGRPE